MFLMPSPIIPIRDHAASQALSQNLSLGDIFLIVAGIILAMILFVWLVITISEWTGLSGIDGPKPLLEVFNDQWEWLKSLRIK